MDANTHARDLIFSEIIQRVVAYEDPPFRPDLTRVDVRPEFVDLIVDCWCDDPEERPHFFRIVERLKKIGGRSVVLLVIVEVLDTTLPITRLRRRLGRCCVEKHCGTVSAKRLILTQLHVQLHVYHFFWGGGAGISYLLMQVVVVSERSITFTLHLPFLFLEFLDRVSFI